MRLKTCEPKQNISFNSHKKNEQEVLNINNDLISTHNLSSHWTINKDRPIYDLERLRKRFTWEALWLRERRMQSTSKRKKKKWDNYMAKNKIAKWKKKTVRSSLKLKIAIKCSGKTPHHNFQDFIVLPYLPSSFLVSWHNKVTTSHKNYVALAVISFKKRKNQPRNEAINYFEIKIYEILWRHFL